MRISDWSSDVCSSDLTAADPFQRLRPLFCWPLGRCSRGAIFDYSSASLQGGGRGERHAQHCRWRGKIIVRRPLDQPPERRADWWRVKHRQKWAEAIIAHRFHIEAFLFPDHPDDLPGTKRPEEHTSELQSLMRIPYAAFSLKKKNN